MFREVITTISQAMQTRSSTSVDNNQIIEAQTMNTNIKFPNFNSDNPDLYFEILESLIKCYKIPKQEAFLSVLMTLPYQIQTISKHLLSSEDPIEDFKKLINAKFSIPIEEKLKKIINSKKSAEMKPSAYLQYIKDTFGKDADTHKELIRSHFIDSLPKNMGPIIQLLSPTCPLDDIAEAADKLFNACEANAVTLDEKLLQNINAISNQNLENDLSKKLDELQKQISSLQDDIQKIKNEKKFRFRSVSRESRPQNQSTQNRRRSHSFQKPNICYWHATFKEKSYKCNKPCDFARLNGMQMNNVTKNF